MGEEKLYGLNIPCPGCETSINFIEFGIRVNDGDKDGVVLIPELLVPNPMENKSGVCSNKDCGWSKVKI